MSTNRELVKIIMGPPHNGTPYSHYKDQDRSRFASMKSLKQSRIPNITLILLKKRIPVIGIKILRKKGNVCEMLV